MTYAIEEDEVMKARHRALSKVKPVPVVEMPREKKKGRRRKRRSLTTKGLRRLKRLESQATKVVGDVPPTVVGLRRKPVRTRREPRLAEYGIAEDTRTNQEVLDEFLS